MALKSSKTDKLANFTLKRGLVHYDLRSFAFSTNYHGNSPLKWPKISSKNWTYAKF
jgi:hypothetical protein